MQQPLVSIITPVYRVEQYIHRCIRSILKQTYQNFELILIDDGSPDQCGKICDEYALRDKRIRVIHQNNQGVSAARNKGLDCARGDYIAFVDPDDYVASQFLDHPLKTMLENEADMVVFNVVRSGKKQKKIIGWNIQNGDISSENIKKRLLLGEDCQIWRKLYKKYVWEDIRFPEGKTYEDIYVNIDVLNRAKCIRAIPDPLYFYELGQHGSITQNRTISNRKNELEAWVYLYKHTNGINGEYWAGRLMQYRALAALDVWAYLSIKYGKCDLVEIKNIRCEITDREIELSPECLQLEFHIMKFFVAYEMKKLCKSIHMGFTHAQKDLVRQGIRAVCLYSELHKRIQDQGDLWPIDFINKCLLDSGIVWTQQVMYKFLISDWGRWLARKKGKHLLKQGF